MNITRHAKRCLVNMSYHELEALNAVVERGLFAIEGEEVEDGDAWKASADLSLAARKAFGRWQGLNPLVHKPYRKPRTAAKAKGGQEPARKPKASQRAAE